MKTYPSSLRSLSLNLGSRLQKTWHCALPIAALLLASNAHAATQYWDSDGISTNGTTAGSGTWNLTSSLWLTGTSTPDGVWTNENAAVFAGNAGTYSVDIGESGISAPNIYFRSSGYTLTSSTAQTVKSTYIYLDANGITATIGANVTISGTSTMYIKANSNYASTLNVYGTIAVQNTSTQDISIGGNSAPTVNLEAGGQITARRLLLGNTYSAPYGTLNVNGGYVSAIGGVLFHLYGAGQPIGGGTVTLSSGTISAAGDGLSFGSNVSDAGVGVFNLNGGVLSVNKVIAYDNYTGTLNFNGGTLLATTSTTGFMATTGTNTHAKVLEGGAIIDTQTYNITVARPLENGTTNDGGLTKKGTGALTLAGVNTYVGATTIKSGTLALASTGSIDTSSTIVVGDAGSTGTVFDVTAKSGFTVGASQTLKGIGTVKGAAIVSGTLAPGNSVGTITTGSLTLAATSALDVELGRDVTGAISDRTNIVGTVGIVSGADLRLTLYTGLSSPEIGDIFYLLNNDGSEAITGEFTKLNGVDTTLSEGSKFDWNNFQWEITYKANNGTAFSGGNDMAIMAVAAVPEPSTWAMIVGGMGMLALGNRVRRRMPR